MKKVIILACSCFLLAACGNSAKTNNSTSADSTATQVADIHNAETSLDYEGTYKGVFPAADCPGIETTLTLNPDKTFTLHSVYIDRDSSFDEKGTYTLEGNILTLKEEGGEISYYKVEENKVRLLNDDKQEITEHLPTLYSKQRIDKKILSLSKDTGNKAADQSFYFRYLFLFLCFIVFREQFQYFLCLYK